MRTTTPSGACCKHLLAEGLDLPWPRRDALVSALRHWHLRYGDQRGALGGQHTSVYVRFPLVDRHNEYLLVWTTTPWTLPANVAAAVNPDLTYVKVEQDGEFYYLSADVVPQD